MKKIAFLFCFMFLFNGISVATDLKTNKHFSKLIKSFDINSIELVENIGTIFSDPIVKITLKDGRYFCIKHAFSKNPKKLMLYSLDDYDCSYFIENDSNVEKSERGINFNYLEQFLGVRLKGIEDIIIHYEEIHYLIYNIDSMNQYYKMSNSGGISQKNEYKNQDYPGLLKVGKRKIIFEIFDMNITRRENRTQSWNPLSEL